MFSSDFLNMQHRRLRSRKNRKLHILQEGGEQALSHSAEDITQIDIAMRRMEKKQYGFCTNCGGPIQQERLEAIPEALKCRGCQESEEQIGHA